MCVNVSIVGRFYANLRRLLRGYDTKHNMLSRILLRQYDVSNTLMVLHESFKRRY